MARVGIQGMHMNFWWGNLSKNRHFEDKGYERITVRGIFKRWVLRIGDG
jgi:hypothetical protein